MEIKKGDRFKCINDLYVEYGNIKYHTGKVYTSNADGYITDESGNHHKWVNETLFNETFIKLSPIETTIEIKEDKVSHPKHYTWLKEKCGVEVIDITRHFNFDIGNALKYLLRAGHKDEEGYTTKEKQLEDLRKAIFYINDEIKQIENGKAGDS